MNEDEVLTQLRDIHLPGELEQTVNSGFAVWPFVVLALFVLMILVVRFWKRNHWRRHARMELSRILSINDPAAQWSLLLEFASALSTRSGRSVNLPQIAFMRPENLSEQQRSEFVGFLNAEIRR